MKAVPRSNTAIRLLLALMLLLAPISLAYAAAPAGTVTHVSGPLAVQKGDGSVRALSINSMVEEGDTLITEKRTYARIKFRDTSEVTLRPNTRFKVEQFSHSKDRPADDKAVFNLIKGGLRTVTGQIGKRGNQESYRMQTPTATIGIRGTYYDATHCMPAECDNLSPGLYIQVLDGIIFLSNQGGSQSFTAGQFGYTPSSTTPPAILPKNPGIPAFTPPPSVPTLTSGGAAPRAAASAGCEVR